MYTANTMATAIEALGMSLPYSSSSPADSEEKRIECEVEAPRAMKRLLEMDLKPRDIMTKGAFENAIRMVMMTGGSTNAVLHLIAMSRSCQDPEARRPWHTGLFSPRSRRPSSLPKGVLPSWRT